MVTDCEQQALLLNADLMGEHQAIVHYLTHAWTVVQQFGGSIEAIARDEMRHFKWLAHVIVAIGGVPDLTPPDWRPVFSGSEALDYDIHAEEEAISQYQAHRRDIADERIQALLARIVVDEEDHRRQFVAMRRDWTDVKSQPDLPAEVRDVGGKFQALVSTEYGRILQYLMQSFLSRHAREMGLDAEDRAIDEMKHLSWMAEAMAQVGLAPRLETTAAPVPAAQIYGAVRNWAVGSMPDLVPIVDRIMAHEEYQRTTRYDSPWTVGSAVQGGWG